MSALERRKPYAPPTLGLNTRFSPGTLNELECEALENYQINNDGTLEKYPGYVLDGSPFPATADSFIRTLFNFRRGATVNQLLIAASDAANTNSTYKVDLKYTIGDGTYTYLTFGIGTATFTNAGTSVTGTNTSWNTELKSGDKIKLASDPDSDYTEIATVNSNTSLTLVSGGYLGSSGGPAAYKARKIWNNGNIPAITTFNNVAIIVDGNGVPQQYDGTNIFNLINSYSGTVVTTQPNAAPIGDYLAIYKNRVFMATQAGSLYWSHANDQTFWDPASVEPIMPSDGGTIVAIKSFANSIFVFKNNGNIYRVFGNFDDSAVGTVADIIRVDYSEKIGLIASRSVFVHGSLLYFVAQTGIYTIDQRGVMQKISYLIDPTTANLNFGLPGNTNKNFPFVTTAEWNTGSHKGTFSSSSTQTLQTFFDDFRQTDALQLTSTCSIAIGADNTVFVAYVPNSNHQQLNFVRYRPAGTTLGGNAIQKETSIINVTKGNISSVSIDVSTVDETVGILFGVSNSNPNHAFYVERSPDITSPFSYGTWSGVVDIGAIGAPVNAINFVFSSGGVQYASIAANDGVNGYTRFATKSGGVWSITNIDASGTTLSANFIRTAFIIDNSANLYISTFNYTTKKLICFKSTNNGVNWSIIDNITFTNALDPRSALSLGINHAGHVLAVFSDSTGAVIKRDHTNTTTSTISTVANSFCGGWFPFYNTLNSINLDTDNYYRVSGTNPSSVESFISNFNSGGGIGTTITNPNSNVISDPTNGNLHPAMQPLKNNGRVIAFIGFGTNSNEIVIRRIAPYANWTGPEQVDTSLTSWGTFIATGATSGATYEYQMALASAHPATSFTDINNGAIISNNPANVYSIPRIIITLTGWGGVSINSLVLNYVGAGVDSKQLFGISFYNEAYIAGCQNGSTANNIEIIQDIKNAFITVTYPVNVMEVFNQQLYGGSSLQGDLYILKSGFNFNGSAYTASFISKEDFLDYIELEKDFYKIYILFNVQSGGTFDFSYRLDNFITGNAPWTTTTINQSQNGIQEILIGQKGRSIQFMSQDAQLNQESSLLGWVLVHGSLHIR